jgi:hypothetical protein
MKISNAYLCPKSNGSVENEKAFYFLSLQWWECLVPGVDQLLLRNILLLQVVLSF